MANDALGNRMKNNYESIWSLKLIRRMPVIIRLDGKAFHTVTKDCERPFDFKFIHAMIHTAQFLMDEVQGCKCAYVQSDEISLLLIDYDRFETQAWFGNELQKIISVSSGLASAYFTSEFGRFASFDSRAFNIPREEVCNYFIWRQKDWIRNSIQMLGQSHFSHNQLHKKSCADLQDMLHEKGINWANQPDLIKNGAFIIRTTLNERTEYLVSNPIFTEKRDLIDDLVKPTEE